MREKGVTNDMDTHFRIASETYAEKAQRLLERYRFHVRVRKVTGPGGCAYQFAVSAPPDTVFAFLETHGIPYQIR